MVMYGLTRTEQQQVDYLKEEILDALEPHKGLDAASIIRLFVMRGFTDDDVMAAVDELLLAGTIQEVS